ncbi:MAG: efflux RND transporter periplasmic adaptor subunit [Woeseiaceae bacterium]|nr:efflux RND transporter periplasmic adaptor subunit [Woeseiaceae bacterium]
MFSYLRAPMTIAVVLSLVACGEAEQSVEAPKPTSVATISVEAAAGYEQAARYTGRVEARLDSRIGLEVGGLLEGVLVDEGATVSRGDTLATLDTARLSARRAEAVSALRQVKADLDLADATLTRTAEAYSYKGVSQQQLDEARQRVNALSAGREVAAARLQSIDVDLAKSRLVAPFDGVVTARFTDPGQVLAAGQAVLQLQTVDRPEVRIGVAPAAATALQAGSEHTLTINGAATLATLKAIIPRRDEATRTIDALFVIEESAHTLRPGDLAELEIPAWIDAPGYWVPLAALAKGTRGLWQGLVAVPDSSGTHELQTRTLEILHAEDERAYVRGTLNKGELLVADGTHRVVAGQNVRVDSSSRLAQQPRENSHASP